MKLGDLISDDTYIALQDQGKTHEEIKTYARELQQKNANPPKKQTKFEKYIYDGDGIGSDVARGVVTTGGRALSALDWGAEKIGFDLVDDKKTDKLLTRLDDKKEKISRAGLSAERLKELEVLDAESQNATSVWDNVKAGANKMLDVASHPSEWTTQGIVEGATDPLNLVSFGTGGLAAKVGRGLFSKVAIGGTAGAVEGAVVNSAGEYAVARGRGNTEEQAEKIAIQSASGGAVAGASFGSMGGAVSGLTTSKQHQNDSETTSDTSEILNNPLVKEGYEDGIIQDPFETKKSYPKVDEAYRVEDTNPTTPPPPPNFTLVHDNLPALLNEIVEAEIIEPEVAKQIELKNQKLIENNVRVAPLQGWSESIGQDVIDAINAKTIKNLKEVESLALKYKESEAQIIDALSAEGVPPTVIMDEINKIAPTKEEAQLTLIINEGQVIENRFAGARLRESIVSAMQKPNLEPKQFYEMMLRVGAKEDLAKVSTEAFASKSIDGFDDFVSAKVVEAQEADNAITKQNIKNRFNDIETEAKQYQSDIETKAQELKQHARYDELMEFASELKADETKYAQRLLQRGAGYDDITQGTYGYSPAMYEPNYAYGFSLTKTKVKRIKEGKATKADLADLENDLGIMEQSNYFNPPELESIDEFNARLKAQDPEEFARIMQEAYEMFGIQEIKEIKDDTSKSSVLERDSKNEADANTVIQDDIQSTTRANNGADGVNGVETRGVEDRLTSDSSVLASTTPLDGEQGDIGIYRADKTDRATQGASGDKRDSGGGGLNGDGVQAERGAESSTRENTLKQESSTTDETVVGDSSKGAGDEFRQKLELQTKAEDIEVVVGDADNIAATLPLQLPHQQQNTLKAETRFFTNNKKGMMFTDGTGTGKTYTGLGIAKRFDKQGKKNILIVSPTDKVVKNWIKDAKNMQLEITQLKGITDAGEGVVATTYANFQQNKALLQRDFDLVIYDESHYIMQNNKGKDSSTTEQHYLVTNGRDFAINKRAEARVIPQEILEFESYHTMLAELSEKFKLANNTNLFHSDIQTMSDLNTLLEKQGVSLDTNQKQELFNRAMAQRKASKLYNETKAELSQEIDAEIDSIKTNDVKTLFLSATPFKSHFNLDYAMGYLFDIGDEKGMSYNSGNARDNFYIENFGYKMRYNKLTKPDAEVDISVMERRFTDKQKEAGAMSGYTIIGDKDYSREFVRVGGETTKRMNEAFEALLDFKSKKYDEFRKYVHHRFWDYLESNQMYESMKASLSIDMMKKHLESGRQLVLFHKFKSGATPKPFNFDGYSYKSRDFQGRETTHSLTADEKALAQYKEFKAEFGDVVEMGGYETVPQTINNAFGDEAVYFNGDISKEARSRAVDEFNAGLKKIIVVQEQAGKEGINLHDTKGDAQRVLINFGLPYDPIAGIQSEGRTFRVGVKSNAIYQYPILGFKLEEYQYGSLINKRLGTTENLSLGSEARALADTFKESFINAIDESEAHLSEGVGGKEFDRSLATLSEWEIAISDYYSNTKKNSKNKASEGIDYFATPEPLGFKMVEWADMKPNESVLEPSAGHGAIARYFPSNTKNRMIEPSDTLVGKLSLRAKGEIISTTFEEHNIINKYDTIVMNPPFGTAGKLAMEHIDKAYRHLKDGGRIVAIVPDGNSMKKRIDQWLYEEDKKGNLVNDASFTAEVLLPASTFERAGTKVVGRVIVIDKGDADFTRSIDLRDVTSNKELFDRLESISLPERKERAKDGVVDMDALNNILDSETIKIIEDVDTRDNSPIFLAKYTQRLERADFNEARVRAKEAGGYYSRFKKGFIFAKKEDADSFKMGDC